jgi:apolipoprotein N-acyltransferase
LDTFSEKRAPPSALHSLGQTRLGGDLLALVSGGLLPLAFSPFDVWPLAIFFIALLLWLWQWSEPRQAAWRGGLFGVGAFSTGTYWVYISLHDFGNAPATFAILATFALILVMALYSALVGYLLVRWVPRSSATKWVLVAPALWALLEWTRSWLFSGFPWLALGYSQIDSPLSGFAPYVGVFGVSWAVVLSAGLLLMILTTQKWRAKCLWGGVAILFWVVAWGLGKIAWVEPVAEPLRVSLVQGNIAQDRKWRSDQLQNTLSLYANLSAQVAEDSDVIIWPETAIPVFYETAQEFIHALSVEAKINSVDYLIGVPSGSSQTDTFHNSVVALDGSTQKLYHKRHLVPFGEYVPLRFLLNGFHQFVDIPMADFTPGSPEQALLTAAGHPVGVSICFEVAFGKEIRRALPEAHFLVNVSNDAWFGDSLAPPQHLQIARMRALEVGRYMARATNTGITAVINQQGQITARITPFSVQVLRSYVQPLQGMTPYGLIGDWGAVILLGLSLFIGLVRVRRAHNEIY